MHLALHLLKMQLYELKYYTVNPPKDGRLTGRFFDPSVRPYRPEYFP